MKRDFDVPAAPEVVPPRRSSRWPSAAVAAGSLVVAGAGLLASTELHGIPALHATPQPPLAALALPGATITLADDPPPALPPGRAPAAVPSSPATLAPGSPLAGAFKGSPEGRLIGIYRAIGAQRQDVALEAAARLARDVPTFKLAQLVYGDLLSVRAGIRPRMAAGGGEGEELAELRDEAALRLRALQERPPEGELPAEFIVLPKAVHHAIAVDTSRSRLYLFENGPRGLRLVSDHYVSLGKQGVDKSVEGDQRTPLGVYFVSDRMGGGALEQRFGAGAMQINYPNAFDKLRGRTGSGIYLHGVPFDTYSRPPKDSDGCVVLANDELLMLMNTVPLHDTPVVITRGIHWVKDDAAQQHRAEILDAVNHWQSVRASDDPTALNDFYAPGAAPPVPSGPPASVVVAAPPPPPARRGAPARPAPAPVREQIAFNDLSVLTWSDEKETMVVTFHERLARRETVLRQYWERDASRWKIVAEGVVR